MPAGERPSSDAPAEGGSEPDGRRRGRGRDRPRRERRPDDAALVDGAEGAIATSATSAAAPIDDDVAAPSALAAAMAPPSRRIVPATSEPDRAVAEDDESRAVDTANADDTADTADTATAAPTAIAWPAAASAPMQVAAPVPAPAAAAPAVVERFVLPMDQLQSIAQSSGLEWVNSDTAKISAAQAALAAAPRPTHVPRERKPVAVVDEGPLVLVETRKDLSQLKLPFEQQAATPGA